MVTTYLLGIVLHRRLHGQGGIAGPYGMVFMGDRCPKDRHDAVPKDLIHRAFKAVDGFHHDMDGRVEELLGVFWVKVADQLGRVFDVGKQHGDLLAFAFQGTPGGENFFGEVRWRVGQWRLVGGLRGSGSGRGSRSGDPPSRRGLFPLHPPRDVERR